MKENRKISAPKTGMNRDSHESQLQNTETPFMLNGNSSSEEGNYNNKFNEPSNYLHTVFPEGYKVIGRERDKVTGITYYMLTNPETKKSSIGYVENIKIDIPNVDEHNTDCGDCKGKNSLATPLQNTSQTPVSNYVELENDVCLPVGEGFNFDISNPIKFIEVKREKGDVLIYWNDYKNPPRWMNVFKREYLHTIEVPCGEAINSECILIDKLLQFPKHSKMVITPEKVTSGGNLKSGTYEFYGVYCDIQGNEITNYSTPSNPINIFDEANNIIEQTELDRITGYAIKLKVKNIDTTYKYYKIVCVERDALTLSQSAFTEGIHPTTDDTVNYTTSGTNSDSIYTTNGNVSLKSRVELGTLFEVKPEYLKAKGTMSSADRQFMWGLETKRTINLQPVVNLFSSLIKWQTTVAKENLYKNPIASSLYRGYMRDEVQPFALRFFNKEGGYTSNFPLIGRPPTDEEIADIDINEDNYKSVNDYGENCSTTDRIKFWQYKNTAIRTNICQDFTEGAEEILEDITKVCVVGEVYEISQNTVTVELEEEYDNLSDYINNNYDYITDPVNVEVYDIIGQYLVDTYPQYQCAPILDEGCNEAILLSETNRISEVINEQSVGIEKEIENYVKIIPPEYCNNLLERDQTTGGFIRDTDFETNFMSCFGGDVNFTQGVFVRDLVNHNQSCDYSEQVANISDPITSVTTYAHNYFGAETVAGLISERDAVYTDSFFNNKVHKGALFFKVAKLGRESIILEISKLLFKPLDDIAVPQSNAIRYTIFEDCNENSIPLGGGLFNLDLGGLVQLDTSDYPSTFYVALDNPIISVEVPTTRTPNPPFSDNCSGFVTKYRTAPPSGCYSIVTRDIEFKSQIVSWDTISVEKRQTYRSTCSFFMPKVDECSAKPYAKGKFSYWESNEEYPDNKELYDSSVLNITESNLNLLSEQDKIDFKDYYTDGVVSDVYTLKESTDFRCSKIRHFKFPDNRIAPFISTISTPSFAESLVFPMGIEIDSSIVETMLLVALSNNLITQDEYNNIEGYEVLRGDNTVQKSVIANGLSYDMYKYNKYNKNYIYANYPHNDLGSDLLNCSDEARRNLIPHPYGGFKNNKFSFLSPDLVDSSIINTSEAVLTGYQVGNSKTSFIDVKEHPEWTILGDKARTLATVLATAEVIAESAIASGELIGSQFQIFGLANGFSLGAVGAGIVVAGLLVSAAVRTGRYRYQWLETFKNIGALHNFASYQISLGYHNKFIVNSDEDSYLRGLRTTKVIKDGKFTIRDGGEEININNWGREKSTFLSTGIYDFEYIPEYYTYDNNSVTLNLASKSYAGLNGCSSNIESIKSVGSPYITLKNYIPDQFGTIDSVKWLTTNTVRRLSEKSSCEPIFGGTVFISRFSWKRKLPLFTKDLVKGADKQAFNYSDYTNVGFTRFYCDYGKDGEKEFLGSVFPNIKSEYNFDCETGGNKMYVKPPSKFYLYSYGITDFLVESEINCNLRYAKKELEEHFYPQNSDLEQITQQVNVPISEPNRFYYSGVYSLPVSNTPYSFLDKTYSEGLWKKRNRQDNAVIMSEIDNNENSLTDPWKMFKPLNWYEFPSKYGKLIELKDLESGQILGRFENQMVLFNAVDNLADRITPENRITGVGDIFGSRPREYKGTDLGYSGTQHSEMVSTPFGHCAIDAKRGKIFMLDQNGGQLTPISDFSGDKPSGMKNWFKEQLPFKILKYFPDVDIDNNFRGLGITMAYDARKERLFITKRDATPKVEGISEQGGVLYDSSQITIETLIQENAVDGWVYVGQEGNILKFKRDTENTCLETIRIVVAYRANNLTSTGEEQPPCSGGHTCNHAVFSVVANGVTLGTVSLNNVGGVHDLQNRFPEYLENGVGYTGQSDFDRYGEVTISQEIAQQLAQVTSGGVINIEFLCACVAGVNCDIGTCHNGVGWVRVYQDENEVYNGCPTGDVINGLRLCQGETVSEVKYINLPQIEVTDDNYFEDASWTISYKLETGEWDSYFSFTPDYYDYHNDFFNTGFNWGESKGTLWNHPLNNNSFQVFQGNLYPFVIEVPFANTNINGILQDININVESRRYQNEWDFSQNKDVGFNKLVIFNSVMNSGTLNLNQQNSVGMNKFPITNNDNTQDIGYTSNKGEHNINYFYNRVKNQDNNIPPWLWDNVRISKEINPMAVSFKGKSLLERLEGKYFIARFIQDKESRYNINIKDVKSSEIQYD